MSHIYATCKTLTSDLKHAQTEYTKNGNSWKTVAGGESGANWENAWKTCMLPM